MSKRVNYFPGKTYTQHYGERLVVEVDKNYYYLGNRVKVNDLRVAEDGSAAVAYIETGFGEMAQIEADELGPWK